MKNNMQHLVFENLNCEIHYWYRKGLENKWVMFLHGACLDHESFNNQFEAFDDRYNIIVWDARGHGMSKLKEGRNFQFKDMLSDCNKLYDIYNIDKAILIGHSMGGNLAQEIARYHPELVDKLILIDCMKNTGKLKFMEKYSIKKAHFIFYSYPWNMIIKHITSTCGEKLSVKKYVEMRLKSMDKEKFINIFKEVSKSLHEDRNFMFKQPVLLICGSNEKLINIKKGLKSWANSDNNCSLYIIDNAAHNSNQDNPEKVNKLICNFLNI